jgi:hypothetical protein
MKSKALLSLSKWKNMMWTKTKNNFKKYFLNKMNPTTFIRTKKTCKKTQSFYHLKNMMINITLIT